MAPVTTRRHGKIGSVGEPRRSLLASLTPPLKTRWQHIAPSANPHRGGRARIAGLAELEPLGGRPIDWLSTVLVKGGAALSRQHLRVRRTPPMPVQGYVFLLDCSASMVERHVLPRAKGLLLVWLRAVRRQVGLATLICYGGDKADVRFGPAVPSGWNERWIDPIGGGGGTPLTLGLQTASALTLAHKGRLNWQAQRPRQRDTQHSQLGRQRDLSQTLILLTDGRTRELPARPEGFQHIVIIDFESHALPLHRCERLAEQWDALCVHVTEMLAV